MPKELILEIGTEEIPAGFIPPAIKALGELAADALKAARLEHGAVRSMGNPRRLVLHVSGLSERQPDSVRVAMGPPRKAAFDADGKPTKAATGFAKSQGVDVSRLEVITTEKGEYISVTLDEKGRGAADVLSEILPRLIMSIPFPKSMRWMDGDIRFARPIHWLLALYGGEVVPFELAGIKSSNISRGHRFMSPGAFMVKDFAGYMEAARNSYAVVDPDERLSMVKAQLEEAAASVGGNIMPDDGLVQEVSCLVECPFAVVGSFDREFLKLPAAVLINSMREHQRYFALTDKDGALMPNFVTVSNTRAEDMEVVRAGNERVLRARLSDAKFFFEDDTKRKLHELVDDLRKVLFQEKLGTTYEKAGRIVELSGYVAESFYSDADASRAAARAALLCKADLVTSVVGEFPKLQGVIGGVYARLSGEEESVATAIAEHYMPRFSGDAVPKTAAGTAVSVADKMDTIAGIFAAGMPPTGSEDPYALRRQALGIIAMIYAGDFRVSLKGLISKALSLISVEGIDKAALESDILEFFRQRVDNQLTSEGFAYDTVDAVLEREFDDIIDAKARVEALSEFREHPDFEAFITAFKRVANIIPDGFAGRLDEALMSEPSERELFAAYSGIKDEVKSMVDAGDYGGAFLKIAAIRPAVDRFFDDVMVMDKDEAVKQNRLALMGSLEGMFLRLADLSKVAV